ncbi:STAS domain-containing protein [Rhodohalobacter sp. 614A]|uniref:STAS domain-containing protein n=1 Tax=Rhodohalobacter sp. 614A TaxID=2908649 RepID=UPI001F1FF391|nr:STAS domain-containing protein [Rhodohalobacter sp. 614A]
MLTIEKKSANELKFIGRLDASQVEKAANHLSKKEETITIDMSDLDYISSMGLSILVNTYKRLSENGHSVKLKHLNNHVRAVFKYTRLDQVFIIE